jgi:uncharacterized protein (TIGR02246 family)
MFHYAVAVAVLSSAPVSAAQAENDAINAVYERLVQAKAEISARRVAEAFDENATLITPRPGPPIRRNELQQGLESMAARMADGKVRVSTSYRIESRAVLGDVAVDSGYMRTLFAAPEGAPKPMDMYSRFLVTLKRGADGSWKIIGDASLPADTAAWNNAKQAQGLAFAD